MPNNNNDHVFGWIILAGLAIMVLIALLQFLTVIFMILTIFAILATLLFFIFGLIDEWQREDYFMYAGIAFLCVFAFFFIGQATFQASEVLQNNEVTKGIMQVTAAFFFIQEEKQNSINQINDAQISILNNLSQKIVNLNNG